MTLRLLSLIGGVSLVIGLAILLIPERPKEPLVPRDGWQVEGTFTQNVRPLPGEISRSLAEHPQTVFWRSWVPGTGSGPGRVVSVPFAVPRVIAIPLAGYPGEAGMELYLECLATHSHLPITMARGNAHETWVERTLWLPSSWCASNARLVARSESTRWYLAVGTPARSSPLAWCKESVFVAFVAYVLAWLLLLGPGLLVAWGSGVRRLDAALLVAAPATLAIGYVFFFAFWYANPAAHLAVLVLTLASVGFVVVRSRDLVAGAKGTGGLNAWGLAFALSLGYVLLLFAGDTGIGTYAATYRFAPATWSTDNQLPQIVAEALYQGKPIPGLLGAWHVSDRPPLMTGLFLLGRPIWEAFAAIGDNRRLLWLFYQVTGIVASAIWVVPVTLLLTRARRGPRDVALAVLLMATGGFVVFNSTYIWPKMLAAALALGAYLVYSEAASHEHAPLRAYGAAGALAGLAMMAHGGVVFGLIPVFAYPLLHPNRRKLTALFAVGAAGLLVIAPWLLWQRLVDPPGNALVKYAFAGTWGFGEEAKGVWQTVRDAYAPLTLSAWLRTREQAALTYFGLFKPPLDQLTSARDWAGRRRISDFMFFFPSLRDANIVWILVVLAGLRRAWRRSENLEETRTALAWIGLGLAGLLISAVLGWDMHVNHHQSYHSILLVMAGLYAMLLAGPRWLRATAVCLHFAYFGFVWLISPLVGSPWRIDYLSALGAVVVWVVVAYRSMPQRSPKPAASPASA